MRIQEIGHRIRQVRLGLGWTQARLAASAGLSRTTLNQLESGLFPDLGVKKLQALLEPLGLALSVEEAPKARPQDFIRMACTTASVSYRNELTEDELVRVLLTGKVPPGKRPHLRALFDEAPPSLLNGLVEQVGHWAKRGRVENNLVAIARDAGAARKIGEWLHKTR